MMIKEMRPPASPGNGRAARRDSAAGQASSAKYEVLEEWLRQSPEAFRHQLSELEAGARGADRAVRGAISGAARQLEELFREAASRRGKP